MEIHAYTVREDAGNYHRHVTPSLCTFIWIVGDPRPSKTLLRCAYTGRRGSQSQAADRDLISETQVSMLSKGVDLRCRLKMDG